MEIGGETDEVEYKMAEMVTMVTMVMGMGMGMGMAMVMEMVRATVSSELILVKRWHSTVNFETSWTMGCFYKVP